MLPDELVLPTAHTPTDNPAVMKPSFGTAGSQFVQFYVKELYDEKSSKENNLECHKRVEICEIKTDRFTSVPLRVRDLSIELRRQLHPLYEQWRSQKESTDTLISAWDAISETERATILNLGIFTVEQLYNLSDEQALHLGPYGNELRAKAERHLGKKANTKENQLAAQLEALKKERDEQAERLRKLEERYFAEEKEKAEAKKKMGRPKKIEIEMEATA